VWWLADRYSFEFVDAMTEFAPAARSGAVAEAPAVTTANVDLSHCDREQIHLAGAIQPHAAALVLKEPELTIGQASSNPQHFLGVPADDLLGRNADTVLGEENTAALHPRRSVDDYSRWLERLHGCYAPLEAQLERLKSGLSVHWEARRKTPLLQDDLTRLGLTPGRIARRPLCGEVPQRSDLATAFGSLYVLEGATLLGRIIARHLHGRLGIDAAFGAAFFVSYGAEVDERWQSFRRRLAAAASSPETERRMIAAACETFVTLGRWLQRTQVGAGGQA
jgi:heme oxygenase